MRMGWCPRAGRGKLVPQGGFHGPCSKEQEGLGQANRRAEEGRETGDLRSPWASLLVLFPGPNHGSLSNPGRVQAPGVLALQPGQFAQIQPKGLPEWMSVTIQPWRSFVPRKLQNLPEKMGEYPGPRQPKCFLKRLLETIHERCNTCDFAKCSSPSLSLLLLRSLVSFH